ncbi:MAG: CcdB family protein, partial [Pseudomonadota bacterium]
MARFDVYRFAHGGVPFVVDVQASLLSHLSSCVVVPLVPKLGAHREDLPRLKPSLSVRGETFLMVTTDLTAMPLSDLGAFVENIEDRHGDEILEALDFLISGF